jgi:regulator of protease activity HflC (stomatin/prohibitin superfamily)
MSKVGWTVVSIAAFVLLVGIIALSCWGVPKYNVYSQEMEGKAKLAEAESSRQIAVLEAKAKQESAKMLSAAEIERAKGVAEANTIIGESLKGNESYLRYLWIQGLQDGSSEVIYIPTEANLPILEARDKRKQKPAVEE